MSFLVETTEKLEKRWKNIGKPRKQCEKMSKHKKHEKTMRKPEEEKNMRKHENWTPLDNIGALH